MSMQKMRKVIPHIQANGLLKTCRVVKNHFFPKREPYFKQIKKYVNGKTGIEIGGPSSIFHKQGLMPVYSCARIVDGCNFAEQTTWEGNIKAGQTYNFIDNKWGYQYICEGTHLKAISTGKYDFVLSCHNLEHFTNPLLAVHEWLLVLKPDGLLLLVLPDKKNTFDHDREITTFEHLYEDYLIGTPETDLGHLDEVLLQTDLKLYPSNIASSYEEFQSISKNNFCTRCMHHHVFDISLIERIFSYFRIECLFSSKQEPHHLIVAGKKVLRDLSK